jgi:hypothetical protein
VHVPVHLQEIETKLGLRTWVAGKKFPRETYFETIDGARDLLARHEGANAEEPRHELIANTVAGVLDHEGLLLTHVLDAGTYSLDTEDREMRWLHVCQAGAWVVLQAYERACKAGKWPK